MQQLTIANHYIPSVTNQWHHAIDTLTARFFHQRFDIDFAHFMTARHDPHTIHRGTAIDLRHEVKPMTPLVKVIAVPVSITVLMPGHGGA